MENRNSHNRRRHAHVTVTHKWSAQTVCRRESGARHATTRPPGWPQGDRPARRPAAFTQHLPLSLPHYLHLTTMWLCYAICLLAIAAPSLSRPYDPEDGDLKNVLPSSGQFEAFYPREAHGIPNGSSRPAHGHGSFYKHRNPALIDVKNAAAYGFRFDGMRRFNFDDE